MSYKKTCSDVIHVQVKGSATVLKLKLGYRNKNLKQFLMYMSIIHSVIIVIKYSIKNGNIFLKSLTKIRKVLYFCFFHGFFFTGWGSSYSLILGKINSRFVSKL
jgi:hypothetical protein